MPQLRTMICTDAAVLRMALGLLGKGGVSDAPERNVGRADHNQSSAKAGSTPKEGH